MWKRLGLGPVFLYESLLNARRWQVYAGRSFFVLLLLVGMAFVWVARNDGIVVRGGSAADVPADGAGSARDFSTR